MANVSEFATCKNLTEEEAVKYVYSNFQLAFIFIVVPVITVVGLSTNGAFLYVIYRIPNMRTATNFYLANMAVSDGVLLVATTSNYLWTYIKSPVDIYGYPFQSSGCAISLLVIYVFSYASIAFLTLVALERYQAVCRPLHYRQRNVSSQPLSTNIKYTLLTWTILTVLVACPVSFVEVHRICFVWPSQERYLTYPAITNICKWIDMTFIFLDLFDICEFTIALLINCVVYFKIVQELNRRKQPKGKPSTARNHVARMLSINAFVFFACLSPIQLSNIAEIYQLVNGTSEPLYGQTISKVLLWIGRVAFLLNSTINPIIYNCTNPEYRKAFEKVFFCGIQAPVCERFTECTAITAAEEIVELENQTPRQGNLHKSGDKHLIVDNIVNSQTDEENPQQSDQPPPAI